MKTHVIFLLFGLFASSATCQSEPLLLNVKLVSHSVSSENVAVQIQIENQDAKPVTIRKPVLSENLSIQVYPANDLNCSYARSSGYLHETENEIPAGTNDVLLSPGGSWQSEPYNLFTCTTPSFAIPVGTNLTVLTRYLYKGEIYCGKKVVWVPPHDTTRKPGFISSQEAYILAEKKLKTIPGAWQMVSGTKTEVVLINGTYRITWHEKQLPYKDEPDLGEYSPDYVYFMEVDARSGKILKILNGP